MRQGYRVIDVDTHVTPSVEVLFRYADRELLDRKDEMKPIAEQIALKRTAVDRQPMHLARRCDWVSSHIARVACASQALVLESTTGDSISRTRA